MYILMLVKQENRGYLVTLASKCIFHLAISVTKHLQSAAHDNTGKTFKTCSLSDDLGTPHINSDSCQNKIYQSQP